MGWAENKKFRDKNLNIDADITMVLVLSLIFVDTVRNQCFKVTQSSYQYNMFNIRNSYSEKTFNFVE